MGKSFARHVADHDRYLYIIFQICTYLDAPIMRVRAPRMITNNADFGIVCVFVIFDSPPFTLNSMRISQFPDINISGARMTSSAHLAEKTYLKFIPRQILLGKVLPTPWAISWARS